MARTLEEQETIARFDRTNGPATLYTASPIQARRWSRLGYPVTPMGVGYAASVPKNCISFRRLKRVGAAAGSSSEKPRAGGHFLTRKGHPAREATDKP
jgi:hypothetical protein